MVDHLACDPQIEFAVGTPQQFDGRAPTVLFLGRELAVGFFPLLPGLVHPVEEDALAETVGDSADQALFFVEKGTDVLARPLLGVPDAETADYGALDDDVTRENPRGRPEFFAA